MSLLKRALLAACAAGTLRAQEAAPLPLGGYVQLMSNYIGRGLSQSVGQPSAQAELELGRPEGFYADLDVTSINWIDQLHPGDSVSLEVDGLLAYRRKAGEDWFWKAGLLRLQFPGHYAAQNPPVAEPHTTEAFGYLAWKRISARLDYSLSDSFGTPDSKGSWYLDTNAAQPLGAWTLGAHLGRKQSRGHDPVTGQPNRRFSYTDYKVSVARALRPDLSLSLEESWTDADPAYYTLNGYNVAGAHLALVLKKSF
ncbi:MAG TPA: TorF family putative porin [Holophagaceae bacterium]|nr:TorF family putative porin [Holophagaceae bacterium]